jgi:hypothetical protein
MVVFLKKGVIWVTLGKTLVAAVLLLAMAGYSSATFIQMNVAVAAPKLVAADSFIVNASFMNFGDEAAHDVRASLVLPEGFSADPVSAGLLEPNSPKSAILYVKAAGSPLPGTYPAVLTTRYADANGYPFSTVTPAYVRYMEITASSLRGEVKEFSIPVDGSGSAVIELTNGDSLSHDVRVRLFLPDELAAEAPAEPVAVAAGGSAKVSVPVKSLGALEGSSYAVLASMEYELGGRHYGSMAAGTVKITKKEEGSPLVSWAPAAAMFALVAALVYHQFKK